MRQVRTQVLKVQDAFNWNFKTKMHKRWFEPACGRFKARLQAKRCILETQTLANATVADGGGRRFPPSSPAVQAEQHEQNFQKLTYLISLERSCNEDQGYHNHLA